MNKDLIDEVITDRAEKLLSFLVRSDVELPECVFYIGGNSLNDPWNRKTDIDMFPQDSAGYKLLTRSFDGRGPVLADTRNSTTYSIGGRVVQVCQYYFDTMPELVRSFDYTHIQVGVSAKAGVITSVYYTEEYLEAHVIGNSKYVGSMYPLSSIVRAAKYKEYGEMSRSMMVYSIIRSVTDVIERGFDDYEDFKDQLDAVDLLIAPEDYKDLAKDDVLHKFFELLRKDQE